MADSLPLPATRRAPRFRLAETTPAVLQFEDSRLISSELQVVSRTGGMVSMSNPVDQGSVLTLMFRTHKGLVFATAEMLCPVSANHQPFRFVDLKDEDQRKLQAAFLTGIYRNIQEEEWIEEFRSATLNWDPHPPKRFSKAILAAVTLATLCLSFIYVFSAHLR